MNVSPDLDARFRAAALAAGLVDVKIDLVASPVGPLFVAATDRGLVRVSFTPEGADERLAQELGVRVLQVPLDDLRGSPSTEQVLRELAHVPYGRTTTYGALAAQVGRPRAARAVGTVMNRNPLPIVLPCHRVVGANGALVGYAGGLERKEQLLSLEGVGLR